MNPLSLDAIKQVTETEREAQEKKEAAAAQARQVVSDAQRSGKELLQAAQAEAEAQAKVLMAQAEERAAARRRELLEENERECDALRQKARTRLDEAAQRIVRRVVSD